MLHITCINMTEELLMKYLIRANNLGIKSILALGGDPFDGQKVFQRFQYAKDMVKFIREKFGSTFTIGVAGYPEHEPFELGLIYLKMKIDAGADFVITGGAFHS